MKVLRDMGVDNERVVGQCYDGASVMSGIHAGVVRNECKYAVYVHCFAHKLNLVLRDSCKVVTIVDVFELYVFMSSSVPNAIYSKKSNVTIKRLCETRWSSFYDAIKAVKTSYTILFQNVHNMLMQKGQSRREVQIKFFECLFVVEVVFERVNIASKVLQDPRLDVSGAGSTIAHLREKLIALKDQRQQEVFSGATNLASKCEINVTPPPPRHNRRAPR